MEKNHNFITEAKTNRGKYAFILTAGNEVKGTIASDWWATPDYIDYYKTGMAVTAHAFRKTAGILVYRAALNKDNSEYWVLVDSCDIMTGHVFISPVYDTLPPSLHIRHL